MGVYIKGMEMPENCNTCNFHMLRFCCAADKDLAEVDTRPLIERRPEWCPLVSVPPHGRLCDADALFDFILNIYKAAQGDARKAYSDVLDTIVATGDIIPAEESET